jgi:hypothetical protein
MFRTTSTTIASSLLALAAASGTALAGPDWLEEGDAGFDFTTAQDTTGVGEVRTVAGILQGSQGDTEDVYKINVVGGNSFDNILRIGLRGDPEFDAALWLFDAEGFGVLANDNDPLTGGPDARLFVPSSDGVTLALPPGNYFLAVTETGNIPLGLLSAFGRGEDPGDLAPIFFFETDTEVSGPDGEAGNSPFAQWSGGAGNDGGYQIDITPTPGSAVLLGMAGLFTSRRRR